ncbi:MAG: DUF3108 domain-containing protein [Acidobacteriota bacterium]
MALKPTGLMPIPALALCAVAVHAYASASSPAPRAAELVEETWTFQIIQQGNVAGSTVVDLRRAEDAFWIHDVSLLGADVSEDMLIRLDATTLEPLSLVVHGEFGAIHVNGQFEVDGGRLRGSFVQHRVEDLVAAEVDIDEALSSRTLFRGALIWLAHTLPLEVGDSYDYRWFMALGARFEEVELKVEGIETVTVPAGTFETFKVVQEGGSPGNVLYITTSRPRRIVRVDVVGQPMTIELESVETREGEAVGLSTASEEGAK